MVDTECPVKLTLVEERFDSRSKHKPEPADAIGGSQEVGQWGVDHKARPPEMHNFVPKLVSIAFIREQGGRK
jgi:hypothetical protein